jgi:hypothetical protein
MLPYGLSNLGRQFTGEFRYQQLGLQRALQDSQITTFGGDSMNPR